MNYPHPNPLHGILALAAIGAVFPLMSAAQTGKPASQRERIVLTAQLPPDLSGKNLHTTLVTVHYGPGEASHPHTHACPVVVYVLEGTVRSKIEGQSEVVYRAGQSFYEAPGTPHLLSGNASNSNPARFLAFFVCAGDMPLSSEINSGGKP